MLTHLKQMCRAAHLFILIGHINLLWYYIKPLGNHHDIIYVTSSSN